VSGEAPRIEGKRWVLIAIAIVLLVSGYVMVRIVQVSGPGPDPDTIPQRPGTTGN
jgi:hypothetical protein